MFSFHVEPWPPAASHLAAWHELAARLDAPPDLRSDWAACLVEAHGLAVADVSVLFVSDAAGVLRAVLPLRRERRRRWGIDCDALGPLNNVFALQLRVLTDLDLAACLEASLRFLASARPGFATFELAGLPAGEALGRAAQGVARALRLAVASVPGDRSPYLPITSGWDAFLESRSANFRYNLKRKAGKLAKAGAVEVRFLTRPDEMADGLAAIGQIETKSWKADEGSALTSRAWEFAFYRLLLDRLAPQGQALVTLLTLDGRPVAYDLSVLAAGTGWCLKTSFDLDYADLSVGVVLRTHLMQRVFAAGAGEYDFLGRDERYKLEWSDRVRAKENVTLYNGRSAGGRLLRARLAASRWLAALRPAATAETVR